MEAASVLVVPAVEVRDRLAAFVEEIASPLALRCQRENALLYVRGLVEQGGRKSLQPTLFRLEETPARYESVQQFLADSPWEPEVLVRACAERVASEVGVVAWIVDDTGIVKDGGAAGRHTTAPAGRAPSRAASVPRSPTAWTLTVIWQLPILPNVPEYWRFTPGECLPASCRSVRKPASSP